MQDSFAGAFHSRYTWWSPPLPGEHLLHGGSEAAHISALHHTSPLEDEGKGVWKP